MASKRKFHRTRFTIEVLSEDPIPDGVEIANILRECDEGEYVLGAISTEAEELSARDMVDALNEAGSEPSFFHLDDDANDDPPLDEKELEGDPSPEPGRGSPE